MSHKCNTWSRVLTSSTENCFSNSFIHSGYFYSASSSPLLLRSAPDTSRIPCQSLTPKRLRQLRVKDLPKVPTWRLKRESNPLPFRRKTSNRPMRHHAQLIPNDQSVETLQPKYFGI